MEFYAAEDARGGVLEAAGAASIKFREKEIFAMAHRVDHALIDMDSQLANAKSLGDSLLISEIEKRIKTREKSLFGVYQQVAVHFADLHDTPGRMKAKGVIKRQIKWSFSRNFFYWRLRRRLEYAKLTGVIRSRKDAIVEMHEWFLSSSGKAEVWDDDKSLVEWFSANSTQMKQHLNEIKAAVEFDLASKTITQLCSLESGIEQLKKIIERLPEEKRRNFLTSMNGL